MATCRAQGKALARSISFFANCGAQPLPPDDRLRQDCRAARDHREDQGKFTVAYRPDNDLKDALNRPGRFTGTLINRKSIGKTPEEIFARWDAEHPDDPVE